MRTHRNKIIGIIILFICLLLSIIGSLFFYSRAYADKIFRNVYVSDVDLSGLSKKQAAYILNKHFQEIVSREINLRAGEQEIKIHLKDTGVDFDINEIVDSSYEIGRDNNIYNNIIKAAATIWQKKKIVATPKIDKPKYDSFMNLTLPQLNRDVVDASLEIANGKVVETKEVIGQSVETANITNELIELVNNPNNDTLTLNIKTITPKARVDDFSSAKQSAEDMLQKKITLTYADFAFTPTPTEIGKWINFSNQNGALAVELDDSGIKSYLNSIATNFEVQIVNRKVNALDGSIIVQGQAGMLLDKNQATSALKSALNPGNDMTIALVTNTVQPSEERVFPSEGLVPGRFPGKYIDIDLTQQKLCLFEGTNMGNCFIISSGKPSKPTPAGTRIIDSKEKRRWSGTYGLWMPWWMSMGGGYGIHELPEWPSGYKEGEAHLGTPVSHGCVRLGIDAASLVYDWTPVGTPVYIHK